MKRSQLAFTALLVPADYLMLVVAALLAYQIRISERVTAVYPIDYVLSYDTFTKGALWVSLCWLLIFTFVGLYNIRSNRKLSQELAKIFVAVSLSLLVMVFAIFLQRELFSSRFIILMAWATSIVCVFFGRTIVLWIQRYFFKRGLGAIKVVVIGKGKATQDIIIEINKNPGHGFRVLKNYDTFDPMIKEKISALNKQYFLDEIIVTDTDFDRSTMLDIIDFTETEHLGFRYAADLFNAVSSNAKIEPIAGIPIIELRKTRLDGWGRVFKRAFDIIASLFFIILLSPILLLTALAVKLTSKGPIIFKNERVGQRGEIFDTFKFRSFKYEYNIGKQFAHSAKALAFEKELIEKQNTKAGPLYKIQNDPRFTPIGSFIRRWSLDELPQLFNVLTGKMSIVGPRPHQPREVAQYEKHHQRLFAIKPGITGMAQVSGRSDLTFEEEAKLDIYYIENWNPWLDIVIILKTPLAILKSRKAE